MSTKPQPAQPTKQNAPADKKSVTDKAEAKKSAHSRVDESGAVTDGKIEQKSNDPDEK